MVHLQSLGDSQIAHVTPS